MFSLLTEKSKLCELRFEEPASFQSTETMLRRLFHKRGARTRSLLLFLLLSSIQYIWFQKRQRIFLPLFPVFSYQSEKVAAGPARRTETKVQVSDSGRAQTGRPLSPGPPASSFLRQRNPGMKSCTLTCSSRHGRRHVIETRDQCSDYLDL